MKCALVVALLCCSLAFLLAQAEPWLGYTSGGPVESSAPPSSPQSELSDISSGLRATADDLDQFFLGLNRFLREADLIQADLDFTLTESMQSAENGLDSIKASMKLYRSQRLELWVWRGTTALGIAGVIAALAWGASR
jgi:hypothetical protein